MISIVIPVYNQHEMTAECITAIREHTQDFELVIIDNGSEPPFKVPFIGFAEMVLIRNEENKGFPAAINQGIRAAHGDIVILLNNDVTVTPGWAEKLIKYLNEFSIVGPLTNFCIGDQQVIITTYQNRDELDKEAEAISEENEGAPADEVNWIVGFCMAFKKTIFDEIGEFDESLWPCSGEEIDFCLRARTAGHRIGIAQDVYVHHAGSKTFDDMENAGEIDYLKTCERNEKHLAKKWGPDFLDQRRAINSNMAAQDDAGSTIRLNLGCGYDHKPGYVNIDNRPEVGPDLIFDALDIFPFDDDSVDEVRAYDFLEHIPIGQTIKVITEIWRVLKPGGLFESFTPSTDGRGAFQDPTHVSFWNQNSWLYYSVPGCRKLYSIDADFEIESIADTLPDPEWKIIHTHVIAKARKEINADQ